MKRKITALLVVLTVIMVMPFTGLDQNSVASAWGYSIEGVALLTAEKTTDSKTGRVEMETRLELSDVETVFRDHIDEEYGALGFCFLSDTSDPNVDKVTIKISKKVLKRIYGQTDVPLEISTFIGRMSMDSSLMQYLVKRAVGGDIDLVMEKMKLSETQQKVFGADSMGWKMYFKSGGKKITDLKTCNADMSFDLYRDMDLSKLAAAGRLTGSGKLVKTNYNVEEDEYSTIHCNVTDHRIGTFIIGSKKNISAGRVITGLQNTAIKLKMKDANGKKVNLNWTKSKGFTVDGYQIYASSDGERFRKVRTTSKLWCSNKQTNATKYYKVRGYRVVKGKTCYTKWSNTVSV